MPRTSRHNKGRKPLYKEYRQNLIGEPTDLGEGIGLVNLHRRLPWKDLIARNNAMAVGADLSGVSVEQILAAPKYRGGQWYSNHLRWGADDLGKLKLLCEASADIEKVSVALGRPPSNIIHRARDTGLSLPPAWARLITKYKARLREDPLLQFPYIKKSRPEHADLLRANALVPRGFTEDVRADICQSMMLALFEGTVTLDELEKNKSSMRYFIGKFYKQQRPWEEVTGIETGDGDDTRAYYDRDPDAMAEWRENETNEIRGNWRAHNAHMKPTLPTQIDEIYTKEVRATASFSHSVGAHVDLDTVRAALDNEDWGGKVGTMAGLASCRHAIIRAKERFGLVLGHNDLKQITAFCMARKPHHSDAARDSHHVKIRGQRVEVIIEPTNGHVISVTPR